MLGSVSRRGDNYPDNEELVAAASGIEHRIGELDDVELVHQLDCLEQGDSKDRRIGNGRVWRPYTASLPLR